MPNTRQLTLFSFSVWTTKIQRTMRTIRIELQNGQTKKNTNRNRNYVAHYWSSRVQLCIYVLCVRSLYRSLQHSMSANMQKSRKRKKGGKKSCARYFFLFGHLLHVSLRTTSSCVLSGRGAVYLSTTPDNLAPYRILP